MENVAPREDTDGAQAIIIAAFLVAIGILVLSVLLNGLIFSQNLATRDEGIDERKILEVNQGTQDAVRTAMTGNRTTPGDAEDEFDLFMNLYEEELLDRYRGRQSAVSLDPKNISNIDSTTVWAVGQRCGVSLGSGACNFTDETGATNWQVTNDTDAFDGDSPYRMEFNVTRPSTGTEFVVNATDGPGFSVPPPFASDGWRMEVSDNEIVFSEGSDFPFGSSSSYDWSDIDGSHARIEVMEERINNKTQINGSAVDTQEQGLDSDIEQVVFENASVVEGTYDIRIDRNTDVSKIQGPCETTPDVCELAQTDDRDLYAVGVIHEVDGVRASYTDAGTTHTTEIGATLRQEDLILEER